jgi:hypothetical protein
MASLREKAEAELEQMARALRALPSARRVNELSVLELGGTASLLSSTYHGMFPRSGLVGSCGRQVFGYAGARSNRRNHVHAHADQALAGIH